MLKMQALCWNVISATDPPAEGGGYALDEKGEKDLEKIVTEKS